MNQRFQPARLLALLLLLVSLVTGCGPGQAGDGPMWVDPGTIRLSPDRRQVTVEIHNRSGVLRPVGEYALEGPDWGSFRFVDPSLPRSIPAEDSVTLELAVSVANFRSADGTLRDGEASLRFASNRHKYEIPVVFQAAADGGPGPIGLGLLVLLLVLPAGLLAGRGLGLGSRSPDRPRGAPLLAAAFASLLLVALTIPLGPAWCSGRLGDPVGPLELAQCRLGLGGSELIGLSAGPGLLWLWIALAAVTITTTIAACSLTTRDPLPRVGLAGLRLLGMSVLLATAFAALNPASSALSELVLAQTRATPMLGVEGPRWGIVAQPLGFCLALLLTAGTRPEIPTAPTPPTLEAGRATALLRLLDRLDAAVWAAVLATVYLGGWTLPLVSVGLSRSVPLMPLGVELVLGLVVLALEIGLVLVLSDRLRGWLAGRPAAGERERLRLHGRWTLPLILANILTLLFL